MSLNLNASLEWTKATPPEKASLQNLQGNILKGHGREHTVNVLLKLDPADIPGNRAFVRGLGNSVTNAWDQLESAKKHREAKDAGLDPPASPPFVALFISATGYARLGLTPAQTPADPRFKAGLKKSGPTLKDPAVSEWDSELRGDIDVLLLVGAEKPADAKNAVKDLLKPKKPGVVVLRQEVGIAYKNANGDGVEHFGYVDGRSQPLMLVEDIEREAQFSTGIKQWDPTFPLGTALVSDPAGDSSAFGSYFVFRKLEQNVKGFKEREDLLADALGFKGNDRERAGALAVGRFEDGTPIVLQHGEGMQHPVSNNFGYDEDQAGRKCPFQSHIRKTNPRGDSIRLGATLEEERSHLMARRGITYGKRRTRKGEFLDRPRGGVGLLFMAYQNDIANQFEFTQVFWANNPNFVKGPTSTDPRDTGIDPVIGQGSVTDQNWPTTWGGDATINFSFGGFVTMKGGEYFFAPALSTLKAL